MGSKKNRKPLSRSKRFDILMRDLRTCQYCGQRCPNVVLHVDHIIPVSKGGTNDDENLITACSACNFGKETKIVPNFTRTGKLGVLIREEPEPVEELEPVKQAANPNRHPFSFLFNFLRPCAC